MNKKAFTLVELLGVIVLLSGLLILVTVSILNVVQNTNSNLDESAKTVLYTATETYLKNNPNLANGKYTVKVSDLIKSDIINETFLSAQDEKKITMDSCVKADVTNGVMSYDFEYTCES